MNFQEYLSEASGPYDLKKHFQRLNREVFIGTLHLHFPLVWRKSKRRAGWVKTNTKRLSTGDVLETWVTELGISTYFKWPKKRFIAILLHEMIHVKLIQEDMEDRNSHHGRNFKREMERIRNMGYEVTRTENAADFELADDVSTKELYGVMINENVIMILQSLSREQLKDLLERIVYQARAYNKEFKLELVKSSHKWFMRFPHSRTIKSALKRQYEMPLDIYEDLKNDIYQTITVSSNGEVEGWE